MRNRKNNNIKNIKDYIVPIITFLLIFLLIYIVFSGGDDSNNKANIEHNLINKQGVEIKFGSPDTQIEIIRDNDKKQIVNDLYKITIGESIVVKSGDVSFEIPNKVKVSLNTNGKITYISDNEIKLESSSLWIETFSDEKIKARYVEINLGKDSIANIEQNEVSSTVYLLKGTAEVKTLVGKTTYLTAGQKISILQTDASKEDLDINLLKEDFDNYFKISDWYLKNSGAITLETEEQINLETNSSTGSLTGTGETKKEKKYSNISGLLNFDNIYDEGSVDSEKTNISGKFIDDRISKITINGKDAIINLENKTFNLVGVDTSKKENDIVIKIYDEEGNLLSKYPYTLYYSNGNNQKSDNNFAKVNSEPYPVNGSDFIISIPTIKNGETTSSENTFYGTVKNPDVKSVTINGYRLKTFNGKTFRYHAYKRFRTLGEGVNNYEIKYYDANGKVILKKYITINKKSNKLKKVKKISDEAKVN